MTECGYAGEQGSGRTETAEGTLGPSFPRGKEVFGIAVGRLQEGVDMKCPLKEWSCCGDV